MKKETFMAILEEDSMILTEKQLWEMIDEELAKDPSEMDTDLVDLCLDALDGKFDDEEIRQLNSRKRLRPGKILLVAAVIVLILGISLPVCAKHLNLNTGEGIVHYTGDHFKVNMTSSQNSVDVLSKLENENLNAIIPNELLKSEYIYDNYRVHHDSNEFKTYAVDFGNKDFTGTITINKYNDDYDFAIGQNFANEDFEDFEQINKNNIEILVFGDNETSYIYYIVDNMEYSILLNCDYSVAYNIAKTL